MNIEQAAKHGFPHMAAMENAAMWRKAGEPAKENEWLAKAERMRNGGKPITEWKSPGEATRARIMAYLGNGPRTAAEVAKELGRSKAHTSELLRELRDAGKVQSSSPQGPKGKLWRLAG